MGEGITLEERKSSKEGQRTRPLREAVGPYLDSIGNTFLTRDGEIVGKLPGSR